MANEKKLTLFQLHIDMYPLTKHEQQICEALFAHVAAVNLINESESQQQFILLQDLLPFIENILFKHGGTCFTSSMTDSHLHVCRPNPYQQIVNDLAIISYQPAL